MQQQDKAEDYRKEANRCADLAKSTQLEFLSKIYRKAAVGYVLMAEDAEKPDLEHLTRRLNRLWIHMTVRIRFNIYTGTKGASHEWGSLILTICANVSLLQSKPVIPA